MHSHRRVRQPTRDRIERDIAGRKQKGKHGEHQPSDGETADKNITSSMYDRQSKTVG